MGVIRVISLKSVSSGANYVKVVEVRRILFVTKNVAEKRLTGKTAVHDLLPQTCAYVLISPKSDPTPYWPRNLGSALIFFISISHAVSLITRCTQQYHY